MTADRVFSVFVGAVVVIIVVVIAVVPFTIKKDNEFAAACQAKDGKILRTRDRQYCIRKDVFVNVD